MSGEHATRREEVLAMLTANKGEWVNGPELANEVTGGSEGLKRLRELRADGYAIEERRHPDPSRTSWQYRLALEKPAEPKPYTPEAVPTPTQWECEACGAIVKRVEQIVLGGYGQGHCHNRDCPSKKRGYPVFFKPRKEASHAQS